LLLLRFILVLKRSDAHRDHLYIDIIWFKLMLKKQPCSIDFVNEIRHLELFGTAENSLVPFSKN